MKCLLFILSLSFCSFEFAQITQHDSLLIPINLNQDTLVSNSGEIITGYILEQADGYISFQGPLSEEINLVAVDQLLLIKKANKPAEVLYKDDTLVTKIGIFIACKVLEVSADSISLFQYNGLIESPKQIDHNSLLLIKYGNGTVEDFSTLSSLKPISKEELIELGKLDAKAYYKTHPVVIVSEVILGLSSFLLIPIPAAILIATVKPTNLNNPANPNNKLIATEAEYKLAYTKQAKKHKTRDAFISYFSGIIAIAGTILMLL
jgi:hypothetical protein